MSTIARPPAPQVEKVPASHDTNITDGEKIPIQDRYVAFSELLLSEESKSLHLRPWVCGTGCKHTRIHMIDGHVYKRKEIKKKFLLFVCMSHYILGVCKRL